MRRSNFRILLWFWLLCVSMAPVAAQSSVPSTDVSTAQQISQEKIERIRKNAYPRIFEGDPVNIAVFRWVNSHHTPVLDRVFLLVNRPGTKRNVDTGWLLLPIFLYVYFRRRKLLWPLIIALALETLFVQTMKSVFLQPRPGALLGPENIHLLVPHLSRSFPSGDTAMAFAVAFIMIQGAGKPGKILWPLYAVLTAYQRMYLGVHFPLDVVVGAMIGAGSAYAGLAIMQAIRTRKARQAAPADE